MRNFLFILLLFICAPSVLFGHETIADTTYEHSHIVQDINVNAQEEIPLDTALSSEEITEATVHNDTLLSTPHTKLTIVRREHDYKRQVWMAIAMMTFVAVIIGTSQSWNPR
jgi:uncharacterized membrane protein YjjP (DUF1212 family)